MTQFDVVEKPQHYNSGKYEVIDIIRVATSHSLGIQAVCIGNVVKYIGRAPIKNNVEDLRKAMWYLSMLDRMGEVVFISKGEDPTYEPLLDDMIMSLRDNYEGYVGKDGKSCYKEAHVLCRKLFYLLSNKEITVAEVKTALSDLLDVVVPPKVEYPGKIIAVDVDNVLTTLKGSLKLITDHLNKTVTSGDKIKVPKLTDVKSYDLSKAFPEEYREEVQRYWDNYQGAYATNSELNPYYTDYLLPNYVEGNRVIIVTARPKELLEETKQWLEEHDVVYSKLFCTGGTTSKFDIMEQENVNVIIDDSPHLAQEKVDKGIDNMEVLVVPYTYNKEIPKAPGITRLPKNPK